MLLTVADAARRLQVTPTHVRHLVRTGNLKAIRPLSGQRSFEADEVDRLIVEREGQFESVKRIHGN